MVTHFNALLGQVLDVLLIFLGNFGTHGNFSGIFNITFDFFSQNIGEIFGLELGLDTHLQDGLGIEEVVLNDLGQLGEVPAVPFFEAHHVVVELFVEVVEERYSLDNHSVHFLGREFEFET